MLTENLINNIQNSIFDFHQDRNFPLELSVTNCELFLFNEDHFVAMKMPNFNYQEFSIS